MSIRTFNQLVKRLEKRLTCLNTANTASSEFLAWRQQFFSERIQLLAWVVWSVLILVTVLNLTVVIPHFDATGDPRIAFSHTRLGSYLGRATSQVICFSIGLVICRSQWVYQSPTIVFLLLNMLVVFPSQIQAALEGGISLDSEVWLIYYALQAFIIPVHWRLHIFCQVLPLGFFLIAFLLGFRDPYIKLLPPYVVTLLYTFVICTVADSGAFLFEQSRRREIELRQQLRAFIHAVSHDLRNPVLGNVMTLKSLLNPSEEVITIPQELLEQMIASGERQVALVNTLLETHATELQGIIIHPQAVRLMELVEDIIKDFQPFFQQHKASVINIVSANLPTIHVDPLQFRRVYENLISNALKYNPLGLHLTLDANIIQPQSKKRIKKLSNAISNPSIAWMRCTVTDNGIGIPPEQLDRLFDLYSRGRDRRRPLSLGLGLYMCRQIITAHGGEIGVISSPGNGSTFWFTVPIR